MLACNHTVSHNSADFYNQAIYGITIERIATLAKLTASHLDSIFTALLNTTSAYIMGEGRGLWEAIRKCAKDLLN